MQRYYRYPGGTTAPSQERYHRGLPAVPAAAVLPLGERYYRQGIFHMGLSRGGGGSFLIIDDYELVNPKRKVMM